jgi:hypothetical protein
LYERNRVDVEKLFDSVFCSVATRQAHTQAPLVTALDDTLLRKRGTKIPGVKYARDPMSPPFHVNFVRGQRAIQLSAAVSDDQKCARMIPVIFRDAASADKPRHNASAEQWQAYKEQAAQKTLSKHGLECIRHARQQLDAIGQQSRQLFVSVDGSYANRTVLRNIPERVSIIGRIRGDAKLSFLPQLSAHITRKRIYGADAPTPEQLRQDDTHAWQTVPAYVAGAEHQFRIKLLKNLRWRVAGARDLQLIVIAPLRYRLSQHSPLLYRRPAYLICTDPSTDIASVLQAYLWRWDIEVNFRDEKTLLGVGQAQVRNPAATHAVPQMMVAAYALLLAAATDVYGVKAGQTVLPMPKWRNRQPNQRASTMDLIKALRTELWADAIDHTASTHFANLSPNDTKSTQLTISPQTAILYAAA